MIFSLSASDRFLWEIEVRWPWPRLPAGLRGVQEHFTATDHGLVWLGVVMAVIVILAAMVILRYARFGPRRKSAGNPEAIFSELLGRLDLSEDERHLLGRLTQGARLRQPVMGVLSPGLLEWTRQLWLAEKGPGVVTPEVTERICAISVKLYDHRPAITKGNL